MNQSTTPQTFLEINKSAFDHNIAYYKDRIGTHNTLAVVIKSNGYGHGLKEMGHLCQQNNMVGWLCVAKLSEALALENITKPILILNYADCHLENSIGKNIHFMVDSLEYAQKLDTIGKKHNYQFNVHIKVDTGLSRLGVLPCNILEFLRQLQQLEHLAINGIFSHFISSNDKTDLTNHQLQLFTHVLTLLNMHNITINHIHMSNSAAISTVQYPTQFNFFRLGLGAYGFGLEASHLRPVMTWKTHIVAIKTIPAQSFVSYACTYKTTRKTRIALLPVGYADGYDFRFGNKSSVMINGSYAPVLGRIAMNITIVDVTDIAAQVDDEVILLGNYTHINAQDLAYNIEIPNVREILTGINLELARIITE